MNLNDVNFHKIVSVFPDSRARNLSFRKVSLDRKVDIIASRQSFSFVISSSSCFIRGSNVLEAPIIVIVGIGFRIWAFSRARLPCRVAEYDGSTLEGTGREEAEGSLACRRNWVSSSSIWRIIACSLRRSRFSILRSSES